MAGTRVRWMLLAVVVLPFLQGSICLGSGIPTPPRVKNRVKVESAIKHTIDTLEAQPVGWKLMLEALVKGLADDSETFAADEVTTLLERGIAASGGELRCDPEFTAKRMVEGLRNLLIVVRNEVERENRTTLPRVPSVCRAVPEQIDLRPGSPRPDVVAVLGYDLDAGVGTMRVVLIDKGGGVQDVSRASGLNVMSSYEMTLKIVPDGIPFSANSQTVAIQSDGVQIIALPVLQEGAAPP